MPSLANVALPVAVDSTFTYQIPPELEQSAVIGVRVVVPFGRKYATGLIVELPESTPLTSLKPIKDVLDASPVVSDELLRLCTWIADYYFAPLGEVLKASLPHGFSSSSKRMVKLAAAATPEQVTEAKRASKQRTRLFDLLAQHGSLLSSDLQKRTGLKNINTVLNELVATGLIETEEVLPKQKTKLPTKDVILLDKLDSGQLAAALAALSKKKKKARLLLEALDWLKQQGTQEIFLTDLLKKSGTTSAAVKEFRSSGLLIVEKREIKTQQSFGTEEQTLAIALNETQQNVLNAMQAAMDAGMNKTFLLHGVTGSGKTQVYIETIRHCLERGKTAIVLVPEISLTPQTARRFKSHFEERVAVVHSNMSANERHEVWQRARRGEYRVIIGPRSAVFAPLANLGLIVVDEEHEPSYKQFDGVPRYNARDVAVVRGKMANAVVVLGSATPSAESYFNVLQSKYELLEMPNRVEQISLPEVLIVDMTEERKREYFAMKEAATEENRMKLREFQQSSFSMLLCEKIQDRLSKKEGIILLQNRRGFAPFIECMDCGNTLMCPKCNVTLTYHITRRHLRCHYCGLTQQPPPVCPHCHSIALQQRGAGTQRVEQELATRFPSAKLLRMDMDTTTRKGSHQRLLEKFGAGEADILLGTQMVAKGLDFARVTLVGVISADTQMLLPDFRASERTFQLLTQVAGRAGRSTLKGEVVIQTHQPDHYTLKHVVDHNFKGFVEIELEERKELDYPPFSRLALVEFKGKNENNVKAEAERFVKHLRAILGTFTILGPSPAVISKIKNMYRWHIIVKNLKSKDPAGTELRYALRKSLADFGRRKSSVRLTVDIDPVGLM
ncbi:primosomal protein N' [Sphingobacteriales bacterium CHB3]|nr:primosomal protein N' [Sphingobacteriales bacterium CHB3]